MTPRGRVLRGAWDGRTGMRRRRLRRRRPDGRQRRRLGDLGLAGRRRRHAAGVSHPRSASCSSRVAIHLGLRAKLPAPARRRRPPPGACDRRDPAARSGAVGTAASGLARARARRRAASGADGLLSSGRRLPRDLVGRGRPRPTRRRRAPGSRRSHRAPGASHVRVVSVTGYRWTFPLADASGLLLATAVAGDPLSHGHGAPLRLVALGHRGWHWVKWVQRVEVLDAPDTGAYLATLTSSL